MTSQEIFDKVTAHLLTQGEQSRCNSQSGIVWCAYRGEGGLKCAIGCLIDDDNYTPELEGLPVESGDVLDAIGIPEADQTMLACLQSVHDSEPPSEWEGALRGMAKDHGLKFNPPAEMETK